MGALLSFSDWLDLVPKVELHCHIAGAVRATTLHEIAAANGVALPRPAETLYQWKDFYGFLEVLRLGALAVRRREDFERVAYECIEDMHRHGNAGTQPELLYKLQGVWLYHQG